MRLFVLPLLTVTLALPVFAVDGVMEINQACAVNTGCFAGDTAGFPVEIDGSAGKSYVLTGDLQVPDASTTAILVQTSYVTVDLGGFEIRGVTTCSGLPLVCSPIGSGYGVSVSSLQSGLLEPFRLSNGTVIGMGAGGVLMGDGGGGVRQMHVTRNAGSGIISLGPTLVENNIVDSNFAAGVSVLNSVVTGNIATANGFRGITGFSSTLTENTVSQNGVDGILASGGTVVRGNTVFQNRGVGIRGESGATIINNSSVANDATEPEKEDDGVRCRDGCTVRGNTVRLNGGAGIRVGLGANVSDNAAESNGGDGIVADSGSAVYQNTTRGNTGFGLNLLAVDVVFRENVITGNIGGTVTGGTQRGGENYCDGTPPG